MATMDARIMCKNTTIYTHLGFMNASGRLPVMSHQSPSRAFAFMYFMSTKKKTVAMNHYTSPALMCARGNYWKGTYRIYSRKIKFGELAVLDCNRQSLIPPNFRPSNHFTHVSWLSPNLKPPSTLGGANRQIFCPLNFPAIRYTVEPANSGRLMLSLIRRLNLNRRLCIKWHPLTVPCFYCLYEPNTYLKQFSVILEDIHAKQQ